MGGHSMKRRLLIFLLVLLLAAGVAAANDELLGWDASGLSNYGPILPWAPTTIGSPIAANSVVGLTRGSGIKKPSGTSTNHGWGSFGWSQQDEMDANLDMNENYFTFQFTVASGYSISLSEVDESYKRSATAPNAGALQYSLDGGANYTDFASFAFTNSSSDGDKVSASLTGTAPLQHLAAGTTVMFRQTNWYANATPDKSAVWYIYNNISGDDFSFYGNVVGDINQDNAVNAKDVTVMLDALTNGAGFEPSYGLSPEQAANILDVNNDHQVNNSDLQWLLNYLKAGNGNVSEVPEPSSFLLGIMAVAAVALSGIKSQCRCREMCQ